MELSTPALLFPGIAILTLGYINRYLGIASVTRSFVGDHNQGHNRTSLVQQLRILKKRARLAQSMLAMTALALMLACASMLFVFLSYVGVGELFFALSLAGMIVSLVISLYETRLSNRSLFLEVDTILQQEDSRTS